MKHDAPPNSTPSHAAPDRRALLAGLGGVAAGALFAGARSAQAGPLTPPGGPIGPTGRTNQEIYDAVNAVGTSVLSEARRGWIPVGPSTTPGAQGSSKYTIAAPGSYYLTEDISIDASTFRYGIRFGTGNITLDLNGHRITANGSPCAAIGSLNRPIGRSIVNGYIQVDNGAIAIEAPGDASIIENVTIVALGSSNGIDIRDSTQVVIRRCRLLGSVGATAITYSVSDRTTVEDTIIDGAWSTYGINLRNEAAVRRCIIRGCSSYCVRLGENAVVEDCIVGPAAGWGIYTNGRSTISNCAVDRTGGNGIEAGFQSVIQRCRSTTNSGGGIRIGANSLVRECFVEYHPSTSQFGIQVAGNDVQVVDNVIERCNNGIDFRSSTGCVALRNLGRANALNIAVSGGGNWYPNVDFSGLNTATNPFANLFT